ncbi:WD40 repeat-like protein [Lentithecium fluviatile CBS 122367]|uniref:WD40 repeat-like protein n=1 Tax=Lentithecium fluviatile CBS 122367 TaxID=1168545 RepID=A0A6G1IQM0_9PLEO|nr:WD40 repeat-like protein [Lentithecium fluviatile CBS 122367]
MNTRPVLDSYTGPFALSASFNADNSYFSVALESGFRVFIAKTGELKLARDVNGGIGCAEMLSTTSYFALVGGGKQPKFPQNKVCAEDDNWVLLRADTYEVQIWNDKSEIVSTSLEFKTPVQRVRISQKHLVVALLNNVGIYEMKMPPRKLKDTTTVNNPFGLCALGDKIVAFPGSTPGQVKICELGNLQISIITAHDSPLRALALNKTGGLLATASEKGTIIRVYSTSNTAKLAEFRRGIDPAAVFSLAFSPDSSMLAVTSDKSTIHIFDLNLGANTAPDPKQHKWGILSQVPVLPRTFRDTYSTCSTDFEMGDEPLAWGPQAKSATLSAGIPGVPGGRPTKGLIGWLDDHTVLVIGAGQDARWERFVVGPDGEGVKRIWKEGWRKYLD